MALAPSIEGVHGDGLGTDLLRTAGLIECSIRAAKALESGSSTHPRCALDAVMDDTTARQPGRLAFWTRASTIEQGSSPPAASPPSGIAIGRRAPSNCSSHAGPARFVRFGLPRCENDYHVCNSAEGSLPRLEGQERPGKTAGRVPPLVTLGFSFGRGRRQADARMGTRHIRAMIIGMSPSEKALWGDHSSKATGREYEGIEGTA